MFKYILFVSLALTSLVSQAQEFETVVKETIFNSSDRLVIDREQIEKSKAPTITSLLTAQANVTVTTTPFQPTSLYLRGGDSGHILILVDGVPYYDAGTTQRSFNLNSLDIRTVEKIEIIKGSQSVLFGGQALSGVIKITTIPSQARKPSVVLEAGNRDKLNVGTSYQQDVAPGGLFSARARVGQKNNQSPILHSEAIYPSKNASADLVYRYEADWFAQGKLSYLVDDSYSPATNFNTFQIYDADDFRIYNQQTAVSVVTGVNKSMWQPQLSLNHQWSHRTYEQPSGIPDPADQVYDAQTTQVRGQGNLVNTERSQVVMGLSYTKETMLYKDTGVVESDVFSELRGVFIKYDQVLSEDFKVAVGTRTESWDNSDPQVTAQAGLVFQENTKLEFATGYKAPSLFQLHSSYGNPDLDAEKSVSYSLTHQRALSETMNGSITLFYTQFSNLITTQGVPPNIKYYNVAKSNTPGIELAYAWNFAMNQQISALGAYQEPWDETNKRWLVRRPLISGSLRYSISLGDYQTAAELVMVGSRSDRTGASYGEIPGYAVANLAGTYNINDDYSFYARIDNVANYRYQESYSYYSEGIAATLGLTAQF